MRDPRDHIQESPDRGCLGNSSEVELTSQVSDFTLIDLFLTGYVDFFVERGSTFSKKNPTIIPILNVPKGT